MTMEYINTPGVLKMSDEHRIDVIRKLRNDLINDFLDEQNLRAYLKSHYNHNEINSMRIEFIKMELHDLFIEPLDLAHYARLLLEMKQTGTASLACKNEALFFDELNKIFSKYIY